MFFYFYKITNNINNKFYFGVHKTDNIDDEYMGSGVALKKAYNKYGIENFKKEILMFFENEDDMFKYEEILVNSELVNERDCYNIAIGGRSTKTLSYIGKMGNNACKSEEYRIKRKKIANVYWNTGDVEEKKKKLSNGLKKYWSTGDIEEKRKKVVDRMLNFWSDENNKNKVIESLKKYWSTGDIIDKKIKRGNSVSNSLKYQNGIKKYKESKIHSGYNNPDFKKNWMPVYEKDKYLISLLLRYSNLPDDFIINVLFNKKVKSARLIKYYQFIGLLPEEKNIEVKKRFLRFDNFDNKGHKDGGSKKTFFENEIKYNFVFLYKDFFEQFDIIKMVMLDNKISDSMIEKTYNKTIPNYKQVIEYFEEIGLVKDIKECYINVLKNVKNKSFFIKSKKTYFDIGMKNVILIDKEFNTYGIDDNGKPFQEGRFEL